MSSTDLERLASARRLIASGEARNLRLKAGMSLAEVGAASGTGAATVWKWETGARRPRHSAAVLRYVDVLHQLAELDQAGSDTRQAVA